jgi:hypothetical protein
VAKAQAVHVDAKSDFLRWLKSDMLPEGETLKALAHIECCEGCSTAYDNATPFAEGEFEAMIRRTVHEGLQS